MVLLVDIGKDMYPFPSQTLSSILCRRFHCSSYIPEVHRGLNDRPSISYFIVNPYQYVKEGTILQTIWLF